MSLFGSLMRDMERDPIFGAHTRAMNQMNRMMNSFFGGGAFGGGMGMGMGMLDSPFGMNGMGQGHHPHGHGHDMMPFAGPAMSPFGHVGFPDFNQMMQHNDGNSHSFSSMSVTSVSSGPDGRPHVYQASKQTAVAPGGVKETRRSVADSRSGVKKLAVGRHIGDRGHVREREENVYTGQREDNEEFVNLDETEAPDFDRQWRQRAYGGYSHSASMPAITGVVNEDYPSSMGHPHHSQQRAIRHQEVGYPTRPSESTPTVTIEELPPSDDEDQGRTSCPPPTMSSSHSASSRRSPYTREKKQRTKRAKKY